MSAKFFSILYSGCHRQRRRSRRRGRQRRLLFKVGTRFGLTCPCSLCLRLRLRLRWRNLLSVFAILQRARESPLKPGYRRPGPFLLLPASIGTNSLRIQSSRVQPKYYILGTQKVGRRRRRREKNFPIDNFFFLSFSLNVARRWRKRSPAMPPMNLCRSTASRVANRRSKNFSSEAKATSLKSCQCRKKS